MPGYRLKRQELPLSETYDVLVSGGGPAGCTAAIAAAREGARVLLVEATGALGGMGTSGLVTCWCPFSDGQQVIYRGLAQTIFEASRKGVWHVPPTQVDWVPFDPEQLKVVYDDAVAEAGVDILFFTSAAGVECRDDGSIEAVILSNKSGLTACQAAVYIDCTGDGDLCAWADNAFEVGDAETGEVQPTSHCFMIANVDVHGYMHRTQRHALLRPVHASGNYPLLRDHHDCNSLIGPGTVGFNAGHIWNVDSTNPDDLSAAIRTGRKLAGQIRDGLAEFHPQAFANAYLCQTAPLLGVRESRRIIGDYVLTAEDYFARRTFPDEVARNSYPIDIHTTREEADKGAELNAMERYENYQPGESHGIPYRCLCPESLPNVLVAGRCISTDHIVQASTRVMPVCLAMGEAAGIAAAMAATTDRNVHHVDTEALRTRLRAHGAYLP